MDVQSTNVNICLQRNAAASTTCSLLSQYINEQTNKQTKNKQANNKKNTNKKNPTKISSLINFNFAVVVLRSWWQLDAVLSKNSKIKHQTSLL